MSWSSVILGLPSLSRRLARSQRANAAPKSSPGPTVPLPVRVTKNSLLRCVPLFGRLYAKAVLLLTTLNNIPNEDT